VIGSNAGAASEQIGYLPAAAPAHIVSNADAIVNVLCNVNLTIIDPVLGKFQMRAQDLPSFKDLPEVEGFPHGCAWGIWDKNGEKDQLGALNLLTPEVVREAGKEIQTGDRCVLKYHYPLVAGD
jgi:hypothetical protein